ncbi:MAG TPA: hypothetical protein VK588_06355, partial [Chitinophagaceae bacterium]|nr:hypothetical protein [Chitinophagaceae bacterium]
EKQNFSLLTNWPRHLTDSTYLQHAFFAAKESMDEENERAIASAYVDCLGYLKQPLSKKHIETLRNLIFSEKDKAFQFFLQHAAEINKITHSDDYTESTLCWIIFIEEVEPQLATGKPSYDWKVISEKIQRKYPELDKTQFFNHLTTDGIERRLKEDITAKENEKTLNSVDWQQMNTQFKHKYRNYDDAERVLFSQRAQYFYNMGLWDLSAAAAISLIEKYRFSNKYTDRDINNFCWYMILLHSGDKKTLESATKYMETVVKPYLNDGILKQDIGRADAGLVYTYLDTYSNLLYKAGHAKEALNFEKQIVASAEKLRISKKGFEESLDKIQRNEPTWLDNTPTSANR